MKRYVRPVSTSAIARVSRNNQLLENSTCFRVFREDEVGFKVTRLSYDKELGIFVGMVTEVHQVYRTIDSDYYTRDRDKTVMDSDIYMETSEGIRQIKIGEVVEMYTPTYNHNLFYSGWNFIIENNEWKIVKIM